MTEPLSREARGLLQQAVSDEGALRADAARRARLKQTLLSGLAASSAGLVAGTTEAAVGVKAASGALSLLPLVKGLAVGLLVSGGIAGGFRLALSSDSDASPPATAARPSDAATKQTEPVQAANAAPALDVAPALAAPVAGDSRAPNKVRALALTASAEPATESPKPPDSAAPALRAELELMGQVQAALRDNRGAQALSLIERYDGAFAGGQLRGERLAAEVFAACQVGNVARAQRAAALFLQRDSSSALAARVKGACAHSEQAR